MSENWPHDANWSAFWDPQFQPSGRDRKPTDPIKLDGQEYTPADFVAKLRKEDPNELCNYTWHPGVKVLLTDWEKKTENQKWLLPGG